MRKITFFALMLAVTGVFAQFAMPAYNPIKPFKAVAKPAFQGAEFNRHNVKAVVASKHFWIDWSNQIVARDQNNGVTDSVGYGVQPIFQDSTAIFNTQGVSTQNISVTKVGAIVDPKSPELDPTFGGNQLLTGSDAYTLDTILLPGYYSIAAADKTPGDTLYIEVAWGDSTNSNWYHLVNGSNGDEFITTRENPSARHGHTAFQNHNANYTVIKRILTPADTVTVNNPFAGFILVAIPGGIKIPSNNNFSVSATFVPGAGNNYAANDIVYAFGSSTPVSNDFAMGACYNSGNAPHNYFVDDHHFFNLGIDQYQAQRYNNVAKEWGSNYQSFWDSIQAPETDNYYQFQFAVSGPTNVGIAPVANNTLKVAQNVPNPCSSTTYINYELVNNSNVSLEVYDITGKLVYNAGEGNQFAGNHMLTLNTSNLQSGVYFYTLSTGDSRITKRMTVIN